MNHLKLLLGESFLLNKLRRCFWCTFLFCFLLAFVHYPLKKIAYRSNCNKYVDFAFFSDM